MLGWACEEVQPSDKVFEDENMELEYQPAFASICRWARSDWAGKWNDDLFKARRKPTVDVVSWNVVRSPAGAVCCESN